MKRFVAVAFAALCVLAGPAQAAPQSPPAATAAAAAPSPKALALTKRYMAALHIDQSMKPMMQSMVGPMLAEQARANPNLTEAQRKAIRETVEEFVAGDMMDDIMQRSIPIYATIFSEDELQALVDFYESPRGQSIVAKMPQMGPAMAKVMVEIMPEVRAKMTQRICEKLDCGATPVKKATPS
jgi:hypothetical protein